MYLLDFCYVQINSRFMRSEMVIKLRFASTLIIVMVSELSPNCRSVNMVFVANWLQSELIDTFQFWSLSQEDHPKSLPKGRWSTKKERIDHYFQSIKKYRVPNIKICTFGKPCIWVTSSPIFKIFSSICYKNSCCHCCSTSHSLRLSRCCKEHKKDKIKCAFRTLRKKSPPLCEIVWTSFSLLLQCASSTFRILSFLRLLLLPLLCLMWYLPERSKAVPPHHPLPWKRLLLDLLLSFCNLYIDFNIPGRHHLEHVSDFSF